MRARIEHFFAKMFLAPPPVNMPHQRWSSNPEQLLLLLSAAAHRNDVVAERLKQLAQFGPVHIGCKGKCRQCGSLEVVFRSPLKEGALDVE